MPARAKYYKIDTTGKTQSELIREYNKVVAVANKRIDTITKSTYADQAQAYYYQVASLKGAKFIGEKNGVAVFNRLNKKSSENMLKSAIAHLNNFMTAKTSTVSGIKEVQKQRIENIKNVYKNFRSPDFPEGIDDSTAEKIARFLGSPQGVEAKATYDSKQMVLALSLEAKAVGEENLKTLEAFRQFRDRNQSLADWIRDSRELIQMEEF